MYVSSILKDYNMLMSCAHFRTVDAVIVRLEKMYPDITLNLTRPMGNLAVLHVTLAKTLRAVIVLRGLIIEWVLVKAFDEDFTQNGKVRLSL